jgi:hypothetical protein
MSNIIRQLCGSTEADARMIQRSMARLTRAVRDSQPQATPQLSMPQRPAVPGGIQPVFVINQPTIRSIR